MYEVEIKVQAAHEEVRSKLDEQGATRLERVLQTDTYYDAPHRDFKATDEALRIRREHNRDADTLIHQLTYKGPRIDDNSKTRIEHEMEIDAPSTMDAILLALGFEPAATVEKLRRRYRLEAYTITLDAVTDLGEFVEIETAVESKAAVPAARSQAFEHCRSLGLDPDEQLTTSYLGLLK
ncbi:class IV adenylate cyclase [Halocatena halophila]|uniref:class IV adenylate cyclase n=1 Tax=Halocatena halophila TaxID=2814576 RepID=UPI002ED58A0D